MDAILPQQQPTAQPPLIVELAGIDLSDLDPSEQADVLAAADAAAVDTLLRIRERKEQDAGERRLGPLPAAPALPAPLPGRPPLWMRCLDVAGRVVDVLDLLPPVRPRHPVSS